MKKTIERTMYYPSFNEQDNNFEYVEYTHERPMTKKELKWERLWIAFFAIPLVTLLISIGCFIIGVAFDIEVLGYTALIGMATVIVIMVLFSLTLEKKYNAIMLNAQDIGFDDEILRWEQITQEQNDIAKQWRAEHPLEEAIRKAQLSKSSVDIATAMREYAELLKGE